MIEIWQTSAELVPSKVLAISAPKRHVAATVSLPPNPTFETQARRDAQSAVMTGLGIGVFLGGAALLHTGRYSTAEGLAQGGGMLPITTWRKTATDLGVVWLMYRGCYGVGAADGALFVS